MSEWVADSREKPKGLSFVIAANSIAKATFRGVSTKEVAGNIKIATIGLRLKLASLKIKDPNCRIGNQYPKPICLPGVPCQPIEGHFITECEICDKY